MRNACCVKMSTDIAYCKDRKIIRTHQEKITNLPGKIEFE